MKKECAYCGLYCAAPYYYDWASLSKTYPNEPKYRESVTEPPQALSPEIQQPFQSPRTVLYWLRLMGG
jgi:hypothetical protein